MEFIIVGRKAATLGEFHSHNMLGSAGHIDLLARYINSTFLKGQEVFIYNTRRANMGQ